MLGLGTVAKKVFGTANDRKIKSTRPLVEKINALEPEFEALSDEGGESIVRVDRCQALEALTVERRVVVAGIAQFVNFLESVHFHDEEQALARLVIKQVAHVVLFFVAA